MLEDMQFLIHIAVDKAIDLFGNFIVPAIPTESIESLDPTNAFDAFIVLSQLPF